MSRCENGTKTLSPLAEKWFRLFIWVKALEKSLKERIDMNSLRENIDIEKLFDMKIEAIWNPKDRIRLRFVHRRVHELERDLFENAPDASQPDGKWEPKQIAA